eukprot:481241-Prymnesium_polylepis.2
MEFLPPMAITFAAPTSHVGGGGRRACSTLTRACAQAGGVHRSCTQGGPRCLPWSACGARVCCAPAPRRARPDWGSATPRTTCPAPPRRTRTSRRRRRARQDMPRGLRRSQARGA